MTDEAASKDELVESIADELGWSKTTTRLHLESIAEEFKGVFGDRIDRDTGLSRFHEYDETPTETLTQQRDRFREIERTWSEAARAMQHAPQDVDWLPAKLDLSKARLGPATELMMLAAGVSELGKLAADMLEHAGLRREGYYPEEKWIAVYARRLIEGPFVAEQEFQQLRTNAEFVAANWEHLSPVFRAIHNRLRQRRGEPPIPEPVVDQHVPPAPIPKPRFRRGKYLTITAFLYEYLTGEHRESDSFAAVCDAVQGEFGL
jgi:hypothetical protein